MHPKLGLIFSIAFFGAFLAMSVWLIVVGDMAYKIIMSVCGALFALLLWRFVRLLFVSLDKYVEVTPEGIKREGLFGRDFHPWSNVIHLALIERSIYFTDNRRMASFTHTPTIKLKAFRGTPDEMFEKMKVARERAVPSTVKPPASTSG